MRIALAALLLFVLAACEVDRTLVRDQPFGGSAPESEAELALCDYEAARDQQVLIMHHHPNGRLLFGDILDFNGFAEYGLTESRSAVARPIQPVYQQVMRADCYSQQTGKYYPCKKKITYDFTKVAGIGRSHLTDPGQLAIELCERAVRDAWLKVDQIPETNWSQQCEVVARAACPLPEVPAAPAATTSTAPQN